MKMSVIVYPSGREKGRINSRGEVTDVSELMEIQEYAQQIADATAAVLKHGIEK